MPKTDLAPIQNDADALRYFRPWSARPSLPDPKDHLTVVRPSEIEVSLPQSFRLPQTPIRNQGQWGSCGAFGTIRIAETEFARVGRTELADCAEGPQYIRTLKLQGQKCEDQGSVPRVAMSIPRDFGVVLESESPYQSVDLCFDTDQYASIASSRKMQEYRRVTGSDIVAAVKTAMYVERAKLSACFILMQNFAPDSSGLIPMPSGSVWGGHWITFEGWDDAQRAFLLANSWSASWGQGGYCWISYDHINLPDNNGGLWKNDVWYFKAAGSDPVPPPPPPPPPPPVTTTRRLNRWKAEAGTRNWEYAGDIDVPLAQGMRNAIGILGPDGRLLKPAQDGWFYVEPGTQATPDTPAPEG